MQKNNKRNQRIFSKAKDKQNKTNQTTNELKNEYILKIKPHIHRLQILTFFSFLKSSKNTNPIILTIDWLIYMGCSLYVQNSLGHCSKTLAISKMSTFGNLEGLCIHIPLTSKKKNKKNILCLSSLYLCCFLLM